VPRTAAIGALLSLGVMSGAILSHVTKLGIEIRLPGEPEGDGGLLFALALATFVASAVVVGLRRTELPVIGPMLAPKKG
jgi:putative oxidoreductase